MFEDAGDKRNGGRTADKGVQVGEDVQMQMNRMGYARAMDVVLDVTQRVRSIQVAQDEVNSIVELLHWGQGVVYRAGTLQIHCKDMDKVPTIY